MSLEFWVLALGVAVIALLVAFAQFFMRILKIVNLAKFALKVSDPRTEFLNCLS